MNLWETFPMNTSPIEEAFSYCLCHSSESAYYPGHQCNPKTVNLIPEINDRIVPEDDELTQSEEIGAETEEALISMQATSGNPKR